MSRRWISPSRWKPPTLADPGATGALKVARLLPTGVSGPEDADLDQAGRGLTGPEDADLDQAGRGLTGPEDADLDQAGRGLPGPEDVVFDQAGRVLTGTGDGRILRIDPVSGERTVLARTGGRPLGLHPRADGGVLVCDHDRGLLLVRPDGTVEVLVDTVDGERLPFASNVVEGGDGTIWFTSSTSRWTVDDHLGDVFEHSSTGRLLRRAPDGTVSTLMNGLKFANGLVLAPDESCLLVAETAGYRIQRYWLTGPRAGSSEVLVDNLAGFPDNMSLGSDGLIWVGIAAPRDALLDRLLPLPGLLRLLVWNLPQAVRPKATPIAWVMAFDLDGRVVHDLRTSDGSYGFVTSAAEHDGTIVLGSLLRNDIAVLDPLTP